MTTCTSNKYAIREAKLAIQRAYHAVYYAMIACNNEGISGDESEQLENELERAVDNAFLAHDMNREKEEV